MKRFVILSIILLTLLVVVMNVHYFYPTSVAQLVYRQDYSYLQSLQEKLLSSPIKTNYKCAFITENWCGFELVLVSSLDINQVRMALEDNNSTTIGGTPVDGHGIYTTASLIGGEKLVVNDQLITTNNRWEVPAAKFSYDNKNNRRIILEIYEIPESDTAKIGDKRIERSLIHLILYVKR
jgi:hypothetical protein